MKKIIYCLILVLLSMPAFCQISKCKIETDAFTNEKVSKFIYKKDRSWKHNLNLLFEVKAGSGKIEMTFGFPTKLETIIPKGSEILVKLENGEILKLLTQADALPSIIRDPNPAESIIWSYYVYAVPVTMTEIEKLAKNKVQMIRYPDASKSGTLDTDDYNKEMNKGAECVVSGK